MSRRLAQLSLCVSLVLASAPSAFAAEVSRTDVQGAAGMCRPATTAYAAGVRNRPLGVANVSSGNVYITCAWQGDDGQFSVRGSTLLSVQAFNESGAARALECTLVNGQRSQGPIYATYTPKTVTIQPQAGAVLQWVPADVEGDVPTIELPALSCLVRPGVSLQFTTRVYNEDVGA